MASKEEKRRLMEGYARSGMTRREYCVQHGIAVSTLDYWRHQRKARKPKLVRVAIQDRMDRQQSGPGFTVTLTNGRCIESSWSFAEADLARLLRAVEG